VCRPARWRSRAEWQPRARYGNLVSALAWRGGIPNPIVVGEVAFNVADLCAVIGAAALVLGAVLFALRKPGAPAPADLELGQQPAVRR